MRVPTAGQGFCKGFPGSEAGDHLGVNHERPAARFGDNDAVFQGGVVAWQARKAPLPHLLWVLSTKQPARENMQAMVYALSQLALSHLVTVSHASNSQVGLAVLATWPNQLL